MGWFFGKRDAASKRMDADAAARALGYRDAEHFRMSERGKARRSERTPDEVVRRAKRLGVVSRAEYLAGEDEAAAVEAIAAGTLVPRLQRVRDRLLVTVDGGWINPRSRIAHRAGLHSFLLRGGSHYAAALRAGDFSPGATVTLVREPDNAPDPNAVAIYAEGSKRVSGYVPRGVAKRLARLMDAGVELVAVSTRGDAPRNDEVTPQILACEPQLMTQMRRRR